MTPDPVRWLVFVKQDCPTCRLVEPVLGHLAGQEIPLTVYSQDNPAFPQGVPGVVDDTELEYSYRFNIEIVPTLIRLEAGKEVARVTGWNRAEWQAFTGDTALGKALPAYRPGCGSRSVEPGVAERLALSFGGSQLKARRIELAELEDEIESCFERGWTDGLPVVPPTEARVLRMLGGTSRDPAESIGLIPPNGVECTVEKVAINAVMAGCKPEYMPVVLAAVEAALIDEFCMHGLLATTYFSGPMVMVSGPLAKAIGMNSGVNALGQGNRANATIGRALQLVIRNVGGGHPGGVDRATLGNPGKYTFCFAENSEGSSWPSFSEERGFPAGASTVSLFAAAGVQPIFDQQSRLPDSLARSFAACLRAVAHPKLVFAADAVLVISPEHSRIFQQAGWSKARVYEELEGLLQLPGEELVRGADGIAEGMPEQTIQEKMPKFWPGGLHLIRAGGTAGLFSAIISGWSASGRIGSQLVTKEIKL